jgi:hypothetical protein
MNLARRRFKQLILLLACTASAGCVLAADKAKPAGRNQYFGAIAYHEGSGSFGWASDRRTSREARIEALEQCGRQECVVVAAVSRACAALAKNSKKFAVQKGATRKEAETRALGKCGAQCELVVWTCTR